MAYLTRPLTSRLRESTALCSLFNIVLTPAIKSHVHCSSGLDVSIALPVNILFSHEYSVLSFYDGCDGSGAICTYRHFIILPEVANVSLVSITGMSENCSDSTLRPSTDKALVVCLGSSTVCRLAAFPIQTLTNST
jgi:hypothetical protein